HHLVKSRRLQIDRLQPALRHIHKFRNVYCAIGSRRVLNHDRGGVVAAASMWVSINCVKGDRDFDENASHRPFGENVCHEFISDVLHFIRRALPPSNGTMYSLLSGRISNPFLFCTNTIQRPSGDTLGKLLLIPLADPPETGIALPPRPSLKGILYRSY